MTDKSDKSDQGSSTASNATGTRTPGPQDPDAVSAKQPGFAAARADLDVSHATPEFADFMVSYMAARSSGDVNTILEHFNRSETVYLDQPFNAAHVNFDEVRAIFAKIQGFATPGFRTYPTKVLGDTRSGVVFFTDEASEAGHEVNVVSAVNLENGLIKRQVDYSDIRHFTRAAAKGFVEPEPIKNFEESIVGEVASVEIKRVATALAQALAAQDSAGAAALFASDATFDDLTLHTEVFGTISLQLFFDRALSDLPYGAGSTLAHVVGNALGGGYEWNSSGQVPRGIVALELDGRGLISRASAMWNGALVTADALRRLLAFTIEDTPSGRP
jgi:hypothetical protein